MRVRVNRKAVQRRAKGHSIRAVQTVKIAEPLRRMEIRKVKVRNSSRQLLRTAQKETVLRMMSSGVMKTSGMTVRLMEITMETPTAVVLPWRFAVIRLWIPVN